MTLNVNGLRLQWHEVSEHVKKFDIAVLIETKLDEKVTTSSLAMLEYTVNRADRINNGGGIITYVKNSLKPVILNDVQDKFKSLGIEATVTRITIASTGKTSQSLVILGVYRPPNTSITWFAILNELVLETVAVGDVCLLGDLNADLLLPSVNPAKTLLDTFEIAGIRVPTIIPTRITATSATCLDLIAIPVAIECSKHVTGSLTVRWNFPVEATLELGTVV